MNLLLSTLRDLATWLREDSDLPNATATEYAQAVEDAIEELEDDNA